nr:neuroligin-2-like [Cherax quadricarinatus]
MLRLLDTNKRDYQRHPVLVYIHGESYEWNSGNPYDGSVLAAYGRVVVVTVNFRLGVLGFLNTNENPYLRSITNYGLMDQIAALHWLKENIAEFGGDADNVTIFGHGTGAACINFLMTSKAVPKMYDRVLTRPRVCSQQRLGCVHGEELPYVWGAPLVDTLSYFPINYTQPEVKLAEAMLTYWTNFARTGNPNEPTNQSSDRVSEKNRFRTLEWPPYDGMHRKYIDIDLKPRVKDHYRSHQLSFWLQLIPQLHLAGKDAPEAHHHLENHNDWNSYRGYVRSEPVTRYRGPLGRGAGEECQ